MSSTPTLNPQNDYYRQVLHDIIDMAASLARAVHAQAMSQAARENEATTAAIPPRPAANDRTADLTLAFDRIARTVRRTVALARRLDDPVQQAHDAGHRRFATRKRIIREVEDLIQRNTKATDAARLEAEFIDRLDREDLLDEIDTRPAADIIADICRDLRVVSPYATNWKRRTPTDIAALVTRAAQTKRTAGAHHRPPPATTARPEAAPHPRFRSTA